jgi:hypothetical protein
VLVELAILALITSRFSGIGAGRDRYVMSNAVLLLPLCAVLIVGLWRWRRWGRPLAAAALLLLLWFSLATLLERRHPYPAPATVELAAALRERWAAQPPPDGALVPVEVPVPGQQEAYNERYALQVLTTRPHGFGFFWDLDLFNRLVADQAPTIWISDDRLPNPGRRAGLTQRQFGPYTLHERPPPPVIQTGGTARAGAMLRLTGQGFQPGEIVGLWLTTPDGRTIDLGQARADDRGLLDQPLTLPARLPPGAYTLSARGARTGATGHAGLPVEP